MTAIRLRMLQRSIESSRSLAKIILETPSPCYPHLAFPTWSNWIYSMLLVVKIVIFQRTGSSGNSCVHMTPHAVKGLLPQEYGEHATQILCNMSTHSSHATFRNKPPTDAEAQLIAIFEAFQAKVDDALAQDVYMDKSTTARAHLTRISKLHRGMLSGLKRITENQAAMPELSNIPTDAQAQQTSSSKDGDDCPPMDILEQMIDPNNPAQYQEINPLPYNDPFSLSYLDDPALTGFSPSQSNLPDDWVWKMIMNDNNTIFSM